MIYVNMLLTCQLSRNWTRKLSNYYKSKLRTLEIEINKGSGTPLIITTGKYARFADGSVVASIGNTSVLTTAVCKTKLGTTSSFVPLTVNYRQKSAAAGRIPTNFLRRDIGFSDKEILTGRMIDRSLRPLFSKGFCRELQLVCNLMAVDGINDPAIASINAASACLALSPLISWNGPVGAVRIGSVDGKLVINPTRRQMAQSTLNLVLAGNMEEKAIMLEADAVCCDMKHFLNAIQIGLGECAHIAEQIHHLSNEMQESDEDVNLLDVPPEVQRDVDLLLSNKLRTAWSDVNHDKISRDTATYAINTAALIPLRESYPDLNESVFYDAFNVVSRRVMASMALEESKRVDGREFDDIRPIRCESGVMEPLHGSSLFQRGQTQVFCTVALDSIESSLKADAVSIATGAVKEKNFFLHYEFPAYATNEIGRSTIGRREMGHGALAEKAIMAVVPHKFPFTIRLTAEVLESNGSSSMASVCGGCLSLLDAGVPLSQSVAGVAMGLLSQGDKTVVLTDILGMEDYLGDMDFKMAGTRQGITALQADVKLQRGISLKLIEETLRKGNLAINRLLDTMDSCISKPRETQRPNWPIVTSVEVPLFKRARFVGPGGVNLRRLTSTTGCRLTQSSDGSSVWSLFAPNQEALIEAQEEIAQLLAANKVPELEFGSIYTTTIVEILERGILVQFHPEIPAAMINNSQLSASKINHPSSLGFEVGQELQVKYYGRDPVSGAIRASRKALCVASAAGSAAVKTLRKNTS